MTFREIGRRGAAMAGIGLVFVLVGTQPAAAGFGLFADCIRNSGAVFYDAHWCVNCVNQRRMFRGYANRLKIVSCYPEGDSKNIRRVCEDAGVKSFPTWIFADGTRRSGGLSLEELADRTGCAKP